VTFWDWLWAWTRDPVVWEWFRPALAALAGAVVGGAFALWGQQQSAAGQNEREKEAWLREQTAQRHERAREDARKLFEDFTDLHREIQETPSGVMRPPRASFHDDWKRIWDRSRSLAMDVRARLIPDDDDNTRGKVQELVHFLDLADDIAADGWGGVPIKVAPTLEYLTLQVSAEGIEVLGAYLRGAPHATTRQQAWDELRQASVDYAHWEQREIQRHEALAAEWMEEQRRLARQEEAKAASNSSATPDGSDQAPGLHRE
jgi:hypothetical protein